VSTLGSTGKATVKPSFGYSYSLQPCAPAGALTAIMATMKVMRRIFDVLRIEIGGLQPRTSYAVARTIGSIGSACRCDCVGRTGVPQIAGVPRKGTDNQWRKNPPR